MRISQYHEQLTRYFDAFPRDQIHVGLFHDLKRDAMGFTQDEYHFLEVDPGFVPGVATPHAPGGMPVNRTLENFLTSSALRHAVKPWHPPGGC
jgi:hypothetical protein